MGGAGAVCECLSRGAQAALAGLQHNHEGTPPCMACCRPRHQMCLSFHPSDARHTLGFSPLGAKHAFQMRTAGSKSLCQSVGLRHAQTALLLAMQTHVCHNKPPFAP